MKSWLSAKYYRMSYDFILSIFQTSLSEYMSYITYKNYFVDILITNLISRDTYVTCFSPCVFN